MLTSLEICPEGQKLENKYFYDIYGIIDSVAIILQYPFFETSAIPWDSLLKQCITNWSHKTSARRGLRMNQLNH